MVLQAGVDGRITPACAGISSVILASASPIGDHPRMRGDKLFVELLVMMMLGSPPHARG